MNMTEAVAQSHNSARRGLQIQGKVKHRGRRVLKTGIHTGRTP